ncbi:hypothetical protein [uncultured Maribacter sp.]|uniref:hypothetical protein n=1 Tax=uncultured Maribacter sp. TaxID=431308 RepID=UPI00261D634B|nr:hypothetical protein [uncultured Maribacter sp.]
MISSIFGKTKPINYIIVLTFLFLLYWLVQFYSATNTFDIGQLLVKIASFIALILSVFFVNFIIQRNKITGPNSFAILFFGLLFLVFPETLLDFKAIFCAFFLILATRRILSVRSLKDIKLKVFDATLWVLISSLFCNWSLFFLLLVFSAIYIYEPKNIRNWLVPLVSVFVFGMITHTISVVLNTKNFLLEQYSYSIQFDKGYFLNWGTSTRFLFYVLLVITLGGWVFIKLGNSGLGKVTSMRLLGLSYILGLVVYMFSFSDGDTIILTFFPAVVFLTNYIESIQKEKIKEVVLIMSVFIPFLVFVSRLILS